MAIFEALTGAGHRVALVGIDRDGAWHVPDPGARPLQATGPEATFAVPQGTLSTPGGDIAFDVAFPVLHGPFGEDGTIQGMLEMAGIPYVGSGVLGSTLGMEKDIAKRLFRHAGIPTTPYEIVRRSEWDDSPGTIVKRLVDGLALPVFVKPAQMGSSIGVGRAGSEQEVKQAIEDALGYGHKVLVEEAIGGREIEVAVLDGPRVSVPGEIVIEKDWYDFEAKYEDEASQFVCPADLTEVETAHVQELAARAFTALECRGLARVDFLFEQPGRGFLLNEVNTMPGFTPISGFPKMWQASGMSYPELCDELVRLALMATAR